MSNMPAVIVRKGSFFSALFHGLFGFLAVAVVCVCLVGLYSLHVVDGQLSGFLEMGKGAVVSLPTWQQGLPPALSEILDTRRAVDYRVQVDLSARMARSPRNDGCALTVIEVTNNGPETVAVLALNVVLTDQDGVPLHEFSTYAATPVACDGLAWRGPLLPGSTRKFSHACYAPEPRLQATAEVAELRLCRRAQAVETTTAQNAGSADAGAVQASAAARQVSRMER